jgi:hypothetical protein
LLALSSRTNRGAYEDEPTRYRERSNREPIKRSEEPSAGDGTMSKAGEWIDDARSAAAGTAASIRDTASDYKDSAAGFYQDTAQGMRRAASSAREYGHTLRDAVGADGALLDFCRRQPVLVAGIGLAIGAALGSLLPTTPTEQRAMGKASRNVKERFGNIADEALHPSHAAGSKPQDGNAGRGDESGQCADSGVPTTQSRSQADAVLRSTHGEGIA